MNTRRWFILLGVSQVVTFAVLVAVLAHYRVLQKVWQRVVHEGRAPGLKEPFEMNREYEAQREVFRLYQAGNLDGVVIGDSLVAGVCWRELLPEWKVVGRGIPGDTARGVHHRLTDLEEVDSRWVALLVGTNDVLQGRRAATVAGEIEKCLDRLNELDPGLKVMVVAVPPVASWVERAEQRNQVIAEINRRIALACGARNGCRMLAWPAELREPSGHLKRSMTSDGIHLSAPAYEFLANMLRQAVAANGGME